MVAPEAARPPAPPAPAALRHRRRAAARRLAPRAALASPASPQAPADGWLLPADAPLCADYDAVLILGGGLHADGPPPWAARRLAGALAVRAAQAAPPATRLVVLGGGTPHAPPILDSGGYVVHEAAAYAEALLAAGVRPDRILKETSSYDTVGNAYFSATIHAAPARWRRLAVVTSAFHAPRTAAIFDAVYELVGAAMFGDAGYFQLDHRPVSDAGLFAPAVAAARAEKEAAAAAQWLVDVGKLESLAALHAWVHAEHRCYSAAPGALGQRGFAREELPPGLQSTY
jgi:uncharacterized SAM-binding protein YcdF (DUF218 family)